MSIDSFFFAPAGLRSLPPSERKYAKYKWGGDGRGRPFNVEDGTPIPEATPHFVDWCAGGMIDERYYFAEGEDARWFYGEGWRSRDIIDDYNTSVVPTREIDPENTKFEAFVDDPQQTSFCGVAPYWLVIGDQPACIADIHSCPSSDCKEYEACGKPAIGDTDDGYGHGSFPYCEEHIPAKKKKATNPVKEPVGVEELPPIDEL